MFNESITFKVSSDQMNKIDNMLKIKPYTYKNRSHFVRCAVIKQIRGED